MSKGGLKSLNRRALSASSLMRQVHLNNLTGSLPAITPGCPLCVPHDNSSSGFVSGVVLQPMRDGFGAPN